MSTSKPGPERDPRRDPQAKDIIDRDEAGRRTVERVFDQDNRTHVTYRRGPRTLLRTCYIESWRRWARGGVVILEKTTAGC